MAGYVGWVPGKDAPSQPAAPSDEDIQGLYRDLDFDPQAHENSGRPAGNAFGMKASIHVCRHLLKLWAFRKASGKIYSKHIVNR